MQWYIYFLDQGFQPFSVHGSSNFENNLNRYNTNYDNNGINKFLFSTEVATFNNNN